MLENRIFSRSKDHLPGYHHDMHFSPSEMYETYQKLNIPITNEDIKEWVDDLEDKLETAFWFDAKDSPLNEICELYRVSGSDIVRGYIQKIYENNQDSDLREMAEMALGLEKIFVKYDAPYLRNHQKDFNWKTGALIVITTVALCLTHYALSK